MNAIHMKGWFHREHAPVGHPTVERIHHLAHDASLWRATLLVLVVAALLLGLAVLVIMSPMNLPVIPPTYLGY